MEFGNLDWSQYNKLTEKSQIGSNNFGGIADGYDLDAITVLGNCGISARIAFVEEEVNIVPNEDTLLSVCPNPAEDYFMIDISGFLETETATINVFTDLEESYLMKVWLFHNDLD